MGKEKKIENGRKEKKRWTDCGASTRSLPKVDIGPVREGKGEKGVNDGGEDGEPDLRLNPDISNPPFFNLAVVTEPNDPDRCCGHYSLNSSSVKMSDLQTNRCAKGRKPTEHDKNQRAESLPRKLGPNAGFPCVG